MYTGNIDVWGILWADIDFSSYSLLSMLSFGFIQSAFNLMDETGCQKKKITVPKKKNLMNNFLFGVSSVSYLCLYVHFSHCHKLKGAFILLSFLQSSLCVRVNDPAVKASFILYFSPVFHLVSAGFSETFKAVKKMRIYLRAQLHHCRYHIN